MEDGTYRYAIPTPGQENVFQPDEVVINEVSSIGLPDTPCNGAEYVEMANNGPNAVDLSGYLLYGSTGASGADAYRFDADASTTEISPYSFFLLCRNVPGSFQFEIGDTDTLSLEDADGTIVSTTGALG